MVIVWSVWPARGLEGVVPLHASIHLLPHHIALINADADGRQTITAFILDDFEEAFGVYARLDADPEAFIPQISRIAPGSLRADGERARAHFDTVVLGYAFNDDESTCRIVNLIRDLVAHSSFSKGTRLYAIACTSDYESENAVASFGSLKAVCPEHKLSWCGGLAVAASDMIPTTANMPRMGMMRRRLSEATDKLILAVRCGVDASTITVPAPVPRFAYRLFAKKQLNQ